MSTPIADREVRDEFIEMTAVEREIYEAVEDYISTTYNQASTKEKSSVGFVMTIYRSRLASSFAALRSRRSRSTSRSSKAEYEVTREISGSTRIHAGRRNVRTRNPGRGRDGGARARGLGGRGAGGHREPCSPGSGGVRRTASLVKLKKTCSRASGRRAMVRLWCSPSTPTPCGSSGRSFERSGEQGLMCFSGIGGEVPTSDGELEDD